MVARSQPVHSSSPHRQQLVLVAVLMAASAVIMCMYRVMAVRVLVAVAAAAVPVVVPVVVPIAAVAMRLRQHKRLLLRPLALWLVQPPVAALAVGTTVLRDAAAAAHEHRP